MNWTWNLPSVATGSTPWNEPLDQNLAAHFDNAVFNSLSKHVVLSVIFEVGMNIFLKKAKLNYIGSFFYWL
jgi:hypothetical protein